MTIIIVNYNSGNRLKQYSELVNQFPQDTSFVFVDNGSTDESTSYLSKLTKKSSAVKVLSNRSNVGFAQAVNQAILESNSEPTSYLLINPDCDVDRKKIGTLAANPGDIVSPILSFLRKNKQIYDLGGKVNFLVGRIQHIEVPIPKVDSRASEIHFVSGACMLIKKRVVDNIGLFDSNYFLYFEDVDYCLRAKNAGFNISSDTNIIVNHNLEEHAYAPNKNKTDRILESNRCFIHKWVPWYAKPLAYFYWFILLTKSKLSFH